MNAIEGLAAYIPAMRELFNTPLYIKINDDLDYQGRLHWEFVPKAESDSAPYFFNVRFYPRVKAASECFQMIKEIKLNDFLSLEDQKYVNNEVINYFCDKWMKKWHTKRVIMLLMWVAEVWSSICGEDEPTIILKDSGWTFDPHALAGFQNEDSVDCGLHSRYRKGHVEDAPTAPNTPQKPYRLEQKLQRYNTVGAFDEVFPIPASKALSASKPSTPDRSRHLNAKLHEQMLYSSSNIEIL
ncbi:hypothetical protein BT96DRAFT_1005828 [Gymnopus androsaceus JB14]|uniref:Uncharacterized protein n=1 Tax=Gymnopus androsaceus JB14 TaxID=1447944 RepID=A0A6A4GMZ8_9AGAR|nr:hypothetical protein BT96DRAFT_1005828 [Gymnopus androsaceus JB14]